MVGVGGLKYLMFKGDQVGGRDVEIKRNEWKLKNIRVCVSKKRRTSVTTN